MQDQWRLHVSSVGHNENLMLKSLELRNPRTLIGGLVEGPDQIKFLRLTTDLLCSSSDRVVCRWSVCYLQMAVIGVRVQVYTTK